MNIQCPYCLQQFSVSYELIANATDGLRCGHCMKAFEIDLPLDDIKPYSASKDDPIDHGASVLSRQQLEEFASELHNERKPAGNHPAAEVVSLGIDRIEPQLPAAEQISDLFLPKEEDDLVNLRDYHSKKTESLPNTFRGRHPALWKWLVALTALTLVCVNYFFLIKLNYLPPPSVSPDWQCELLNCQPSETVDVVVADISRTEQSNELVIDAILRVHLQGDLDTTWLELELFNELDERVDRQVISDYHYAKPESSQTTNVAEQANLSLDNLSKGSQLRTVHHSLIISNTDFTRFQLAAIDASRTRSYRQLFATIDRIFSRETTKSEQ